MILDPDLLHRASADERWPELERRLRPLSLHGGTCSPVSLLKGLLVQRWLETDEAEAAAEIDDRISLRAFCGLPVAAPAPTAAELRAFRRRLERDAEGTRILRDLETLGAPPRVLLSVVSPVFQAEGLVEELTRQVVAAASAITPDFELLLVDDGSSDHSWSRIREAGARDPRVKGLRLSRNFGQHLAITAGLDHADGQFVAVMDCDLQDDPAHLPELLAKAREGFDIVYTVKNRRRHGAIKNLFGRLFATLLNLIAGGKPADSNVGSFSMLSRRAVLAYRQVRETHRHYLLVLRWLGFPSTEVAVSHRARPSGRSSYGNARLIAHAVSGVTFQSNRLLYVALGVGGLFLVASLTAAAVVVALYFIRGSREGWTSTVVLILLSTSVVLIAIGTVGIYIGKIFDQVKRRPLYLTQERVNI